MHTYVEWLIYTYKALLSIGLFVISKSLEEDTLYVHHKGTG